MKPIVATIIMLVLGMTACVHTPKEAIELSATIGIDIAELHRSHRELAGYYFARMRSDVDLFVDQVYRPYAIKNAIEDFNLIDRIDASRQLGAELDTLVLLDVFVDRVTNDIETFRRELHAPIRRKETEVVNAIDTDYQRVRDANSVVTGHLGSIQKVTQTQADLARMAGLDGIRDDIIRTTVQASDEIANLVHQGLNVKGQLQEIENTIGELRDAVGSLGGN